MSERQALAPGGTPSTSPSLLARDDDSVIDADYEIVEPVGPAERTNHPPVARPSGMPSLDGMETLRRTRFQPADASPQKRSGLTFWSAGAGLAALAFWVAGGHALVVPALAAMNQQAVKPLRIASVISQIDRSGTRPVIQVDGKAVNDGGEALTLPPLEIQIVAVDGSSTLYKLGTAGQRLESGAFFDFSSRLDMPKDGVRTVFVTFAE